jgi:glutathione reductase (NADPH)
VGVIEYKPLGGTCVNVGCVPKKVMVNAANINEAIHDAQHMGFDITRSSFNWKALKDSRDAYVARLNGIYEKMLANNKVMMMAQYNNYTSSLSLVVLYRVLSLMNSLCFVTHVHTIYYYLLYMHVCFAYLQFSTYTAY